MSKEYISAIALILVSILNAFGIEIGNEAITGIITGVIAIFLAIKRYKRGDINALGKKI